MELNETIKNLMSHRSIRKYKTEPPPDDILETIVRAGQQAAFVSQLYSVLMSRDAEYNPYYSPWYFVVCVDIHKLELMAQERDWEIVTNDLSLLFYGIQDACYMAQNMVAAAESLGLGTCYLGGPPYMADRVAEKFDLPERVFPVVGVAMGYPDEDPAVRPRYPINYVLFEEKYPDLDSPRVREAMKTMDEGYLSQDYYRNLGAKLEIESDRKESFTLDNYSWTEHICRKWGQWYKSPEDLLKQLDKRGFNLRF